MRHMFFLFAVVSLLTMSCGTPTETETPESDGLIGTTPGSHAPDFTLLDTAGNQVSLTQFRGSIVLLDFWASWCGPCISEIPNLRDIQRTYRDSGFVIIGVSQDVSRRAWKAFLSTNELDWVHVYDESVTEGVAGRYGVIGIPSNFLLNRSGIIEATNVHGEQLAAEVRRLVSP